MGFPRPSFRGRTKDVPAFEKGHYRGPERVRYTVLSCTSPGNRRRVGFVRSVREPMCPIGRTAGRAPERAESAFRNGNDIVIMTSRCTPPDRSRRARDKNPRYYVIRVCMYVRMCNVEVSHALRREYLRGYEKRRHGKPTGFRANENPERAIARRKRRLRSNPSRRLDGTNCSLSRPTAAAFSLYLSLTLYIYIHLYYSLS